MFCVSSPLGMVRGFVMCQAKQKQTGIFKEISLLPIVYTLSKRILSFKLDIAIELIFENNA